MPPSTPTSTTAPARPNKLPLPPRERDGLQPPTPAELSLRQATRFPRCHHPTPVLRSICHTHLRPDHRRSTTLDSRCISPSAYPHVTERGVPRLMLDSNAWVMCLLGPRPTIDLSDCDRGEPRGSAPPTPPPARTLLESLGVRLIEEPWLLDVDGCLRLSPTRILHDNVGCPFVETLP